MMLKNKLVFLVVGFAFFLFMFEADTCHADQVELGDSLPLTLGLPGDLPFKPKVAYNSKHDEYLVVYHWKNDIFLAPNRQVHAARLSAKGEYIANYVVSDLPNSCASPDVAYDPVNDRYLVVWIYDKNGDESNWDVHGRFVPYDGPIAAVGSFPVSEQIQWNEMVPRVAYGSAQTDFIVVENLLRIDNTLKSYIGGIRVDADEYWAISLAPDFTVVNASEHLINPDIAYNSYRDEYMVVYDNAADVYAVTVNGETLSTSSPIPITELEPPLSPLPGTHDRAAVSYARSVSNYVITWDTDRLSGLGQIYARIYLGGDYGTNAAYIYRVDDDLGGARPDFTSDVSCKEDGECLILWIAVNNSTYFTFGRQIFAGDGTLYNGFPYNNLNTIATWGGYEPQLAVGAGRKNYYMGFESYIGTTKYMYGRPTQIPPFPWIIYQPAINNGANP